ncbi:MAG: PLP-dependent aminotransferase family protein [Ruminococcaceae bacterium]|nr:PLP-dependent aminotransferase family protein [Oscillospiraceae bacterium]
MKYSIDKNDMHPAYLQLYSQIKEDIVSLSYSYGSKLPSKRILAEEAGVSVITSERAYELLCDEGYIEARERKGFFVIFKPADGFANNANTMPIHAVKKTNRHHGHGEEFPFSVLAKSMRKVISERGEEIMKKSSNSGCHELRVEIKSYLARNRGIYAETDQIVIGSGAEYLYSLVVDLLGRDKIYAFEAPSYEKIEQVYGASNVRFEPLPLGADGIERAALEQTKADVLHITPYRSFPTGITATASKRHEYVHWSRNEKFIIEDDFESEFTVSRKPEETVFSLSAYDNVIYINTFSKTISPAMRMGYMVLPKRLVKEFEEKLGFSSCTVPTFEQFVLAELLSSGAFERHINRVRRSKRKSKGIKE